MKRPLFSPPEPFSMLPLVVLLPVRGDVNKLPSLTSSFFARYEKVSAMRAAPQDEMNDEVTRRLTSEEAMLRQVLEWLQVNPDAGV